MIFTICPLIYTSNSPPPHARPYHHRRRRRRRRRWSCCFRCYRCLCRCRCRCLFIAVADPYLLPVLVFPDASFSSGFEFLLFHPPWGRSRGNRAGRGRGSRGDRGQNNRGGRGDDDRMDERVNEGIDERRDTEGAITRIRSGQSGAVLAPTSQYQV